jgi:hypothetical protein
LLREGCRGPGNRTARVSSLCLALSARPPQRSHEYRELATAHLRGKDSKCARANPRMRPADPAGARRDAPAVTGLSAACFGLRQHRFVVVGAHTAAPAVTPLGVQPGVAWWVAPILAGRRSRAMCNGSVRPPVDITLLPESAPAAYTTAARSLVAAVTASPPTGAQSRVMTSQDLGHVEFGCG